MATKTQKVVVKTGRTVVIGKAQEDGPVKKVEYGPGKELTVEAAEAKRLVGLGAVALAGSDEAAGAKAKADQIPENFPGHAALAKAGIETFSALKSYEGDLVELEDIGEATAEKIEAALEELETE